MSGLAVNLTPEYIGIVSALVKTQKIRLQNLLSPFSVERI